MKATRFGIVLAGLVLAASTATAPATSAGASLKPGSVFRDCEKCPELVVVPSGIFIMGLKGKRKTDKPAHRVNIARPFAIGRFEVTFAEWQACIDDGGCKHFPHDHNWGRVGRPVINVTWDQAQVYLRWISRKTGKTYRLPSEAEWEYAARGGTTTEFWWGNEVGDNMANCKDCGSEWSAKSTAPVGSFEPNPFGLYDTSANVFEWVEDCWTRDYRGAPTDGSAVTAGGNCRYRVIRGGSFYYFNKVARSAYRAKNPPAVNSYWLGFRVLRELR